MHKVREQLLLPDKGPSGDGVRVAVLDTGVDESHPDLTGRVNTSASRSFSVSGDLLDRNGHGTHIAGIIGGSGAAANGYYRGIAPGCVLLVFKVQSGKSGLEGNSIRAVEEAITCKAQIINFSHGFAPGIHPPPWIWPLQNGVLEDALALADQHGILCVVAAGNSGPFEGSITRPGGSESVLTVGAVDQNNLLLEMSSRGPYRRLDGLRRNAPERFDKDLHRPTSVTRKPDVVAPGDVVAPRAHGCLLVDGESETDDPLYVRLQGSSQATAVASGLAALVFEVANRRDINLGTSPARTVRRLLIRSAVPLEAYSSTEVGEGILMWPNIRAVLGDFESDEQFREVVLADEPIHLI